MKAELKPCQQGTMKTLNEFVLMQTELSDDVWIATVKDYARFLNQKPTLGMFVPCDEDESVLEKPIINQYSYLEIESGFYRSDLNDYKAALDRVIFYGFELMGKNETTTLVAMSGMTDPILWIGRNGNITSFGNEIKTLSDLCGLVTLKQKQ